MRGVYKRTEPIDYLILDGDSIALYEDHFVRLGALGTCIMTTAELPQTIDNLATALAKAFGAPPQGSVVDATRTAVANLVAQGVLLEVDCD